MGYFDSINKKKISVEDTRKVITRKKINEIINDLTNPKNELFAPDGSELQEGGEKLHRFLYCTCDKRSKQRYYRFYNQNEPKTPQFKLNVSQFSENSGTDVLFELNEQSCNIIRDLYRSNFEQHEYEFYLPVNQVGIKQAKNKNCSNIEITPFSVENYSSKDKISKLDLYISGSTPEIHIDLNYQIEWSGYFEEIMDDAMISINRNKISPEIIIRTLIDGNYKHTDLYQLDPYRTSSGKISMRKLIIGEVFEQKFDTGLYKNITFPEAQKRLANCIEDAFYIQPVYTCTGLHIPVKVNVIVSIGRTTVHALNKLIKAAPEFFDGELLEENDILWSRY